MTNKQFVKKVYSGSYCFKIPHEGIDKNSSYAIVWKYKLGRRDVIEWGANPKDAWKNAANTIKNDMVKRLES